MANPFDDSIYQLAATTIAAGHLRVRLDRVSNVDALLDDLIARGEDDPDYQDDRLPYWADLWHSSVALAQELAEGVSLAPGTRITELGCGLGLCGITAGLLGAEVTFTDYLNDALAFACHNWQLNLDRPARYLLLDWREPPSDDAADVLLAADVLYEERFFAPLLNTFRTLLPVGGRLLLSEPGRGRARQFLDGLPEEGFAIERRITRPVTLHGLTVRVDVYDCKRSH